MKYIKNTTEFFIEEPTVISLGKFDGIHRGHELLLEQLLKKKREGYATVIFTFDIPPKKALDAQDAKVLTTNEEKMHMFESFGIDYLIECPFTPDVMNMEPEVFIEMLVKNLSVKYIVAGEDFYFGHNRRGNYQMLQEYAKQLSYEAIIPDIQWGIIKQQYEEQMQVFQWLKKSEYCVAGAEQIEAMLVQAYNENKPAQVRHILNCYVCAKARAYYEQ